MYGKVIYRYLQEAYINGTKTSLGSITSLTRARRTIAFTIGSYANPKLSIVAFFLPKPPSAEEQVCRVIVYSGSDSTYLDLMVTETKLLNVVTFVMTGNNLAYDGPKLPEAKDYSLDTFYKLFEEPN